MKKTLELTRETHWHNPIGWLENSIDRLEPLGLLVVVWAVLVLLLALGACDINSGNVDAPPSAPGSGIVTVQAAGSVVALVASVQMRDGSVCTNDETVSVPCASVEWEISTASGAFVESRIGEVGGTIQSSGLSPGCYLVTQTATAPGGLTSSLPYNPEPGVGGVLGCDT